VKRTWRDVATRIVPKPLRRGTAPQGPGSSVPTDSPGIGGGTAPQGPGSSVPTDSPGIGGGTVLEYNPELDGQADPGEVVWTWVAYEDDPRQGKDRPVVVVGRRGSVLLGLMLSSNQDRDGRRHWFALGAGAWDREHRPSWVRLDRVLEVDEDGIRREGTILDRRRFDAVAAALRRDYGWS
jgi:PemK-like, MazF-like toxin of type II toxin-antitoxin system